MIAPSFDAEKMYLSSDEITTHVTLSL